MYNMGLMYLDGRGDFNVDFTRASMYFELVPPNSRHLIPASMYSYTMCVLSLSLTSSCNRLPSKSMALPCTFSALCT